MSPTPTPTKPTKIITREQRYRPPLPPLHPFNPKELVMSALRKGWITLQPNRRRKSQRAQTRQRHRWRDKLSAERKEELRRWTREAMRRLRAQRRAKIKCDSL